MCDQYYIRTKWILYIIHKIYFNKEQRITFNEAVLCINLIAIEYCCHVFQNMSFEMAKDRKMTMLSVDCKEYKNVRM